MEANHCDADQAGIGRENMSGYPSIRTVAFALVLVVIGVSNRAAFCESVKVEGLIKARSGDTMTLQTSSQSELIILLTDTTRVAQVQGVFKARRKEMSMAALIPGLAVKVEGSYDENRKLGRVRFPVLRATIWSRRSQSRLGSMRPKCKINNNRLNWNSRTKP